MDAAHQAKLSTRLLTTADRVELGGLFEEMQRYYGVFCPPQETILRDLSSLSVGVEFLVACGGRLAGFAAFATIYPGPGLASGFFLKELFVSEAFRSAGVGRLLMAELAKIAVQRGHRRIDWTADADNERLLSFYDNLGAERKPEKLFYRLDGEALQAFGQSDR